MDVRSGQGIGRRRRTLCFAILALGTLRSLPAPACDSNCCLILTRGQAGLLRRGGFQVDFSFRSTSMSTRLAGSSPVDTVVRPKVLLETGELIPGYHEDREGTDSFLQLDAAWGVAASTTLFASLPLLSHRSYVIGHGGGQTSYDVRGIGDLLLGARHALLRRPQRSLVAGVGFQVPTGKNDILDIYDSTILDPTLQPGSGSGDLVASLLWSTVAPLRTEIGLSGSYQIDTTNSYKYRFGNTAIAAVGVSRPTGSFVPSLQVKLVRQDSSRFVGDYVPSTGSTTVYLNGGLRYRTPEGVALYRHLLVPVYRHVNDAQLAPRFSVLFGLSKAF
jgi:hypothetical protein